MTKADIKEVEKDIKRLNRTERRLFNAALDRRASAMTSYRVSMVRVLGLSESTAREARSVLSSL